MGPDGHVANYYFRNTQLIYSSIQRQTIVSQFYQLDRLVVEGRKTVCHTQGFSPYSQQRSGGFLIAMLMVFAKGKQTDKKNDIVRQKDTG